MQRAVEKVRVDDSLRDYAIDIVERTRNSEQLTLGVSPRGLLMLQRAAQARAFLEARDYCTPDDFKQLDPAGLRAPRGGQHALRGDAEKIDASRNGSSRNYGLHSPSPSDESRICRTPRRLTALAQSGGSLARGPVAPPAARRSTAPAGAALASPWSRWRARFSWRCIRARRPRKAICWSPECRRWRPWRWPDGSR